MTTATELAKRCALKEKELEAYYQQHKEEIDHYLVLVDQRSKLSKMVSDALIKESHAQH